MTTSSTNNSVFRSFFEKQKLTGPNFIDWYRQLRIVLSIEDKLNYLEQPIPPAPIAPAGQQVAPEILAAHAAWVNGSKEIAGLMLINKRAKLNLDSALLWHCRLGHISKKRIEKLQHEGLLNSSDLREFKKCVSCMSGKMERKPYTDQVERAKDLLGLIHTDVCGPFKIMSRQGASYFVTFTDDFSQNQLGKTIKSLSSDHEGEYMSQEFLDHLKDHGIIAHHTPPYTPQHN
nr:hypothetical protein [Tanacetum cinerariifolium]